MSLRYKTAIVGASETTQLGIVPDMSETELHIDAAINAMRDAGIEKDQIDGISATMNPATLAHYLGIVPTWVDNTSVGGTSFLIHMRHAAAAIASGLATTILCCMGQSGRSRVGVGGTRIGTAAGPSGPRYDGSYPGQFESIYGVLGPTTQFGMGVLRYMKDTGTTIEQLASVAVAQRRWSTKVPRAMFRNLVTVDEQPDDLLPVPPLHVLPCHRRRRRVHSHQRRQGGRLPDEAGLHPRHWRVGRNAGHQPDVRHDLIGGVQDLQRQGVRGGGRLARRHRPRPDLRRVHLPIYGLEDLGFVGRGEAGAFIEEGNTSPGGKLPLNTNGGGLSYTHTGMYGMFAMQESVRQVRGEAAHQVDGVKTSFCQGVGGMFMAAGSLIFTNEPPHDHN